VGNLGADQVLFLCCCRLSRGLATVAGAVAGICPWPPLGLGGRPASSLWGGSAPDLSSLRTAMVPAAALPIIAINPVIGAT
jgi:hypothetical protein